MRAFGPRNSAYTFLDHDRHTDIYIYIYITRNLDWTPQCGARFARPITYLPCSLYIFQWRVAWDISPFITHLYTLHTEHAYCLSYRFFKNVVVTTVIAIVEMVEILDGRLGKRSVERVRYVIKIYYTWSLWNMETFHSFFVFPLAYGSWQYCRNSWNISSNRIAIIGAIYERNFWQQYNYSVIVQLRDQ